ncbi:MAG: UDP-3-O-(3-hydroxymyristoyl)glucosamine N-acyltransferase [Chlamydiota bacterium]
MSDHEFVHHRISFTLQELCTLTHAQLHGNPDIRIYGVDGLETASSKEASFLANMRYKELLLKTEAGVICISPDIPLVEGKNFLITENPSIAFQKIAEAFLRSANHFTGFEGIHPTAVIHSTASIGNHVQIGPYVVIDKGAVIGDYTQIGPFVSIGPGVSIGTHCQLFAHSTVRERCTLGHRVILQPGTVIGSCGFGYVTDHKGCHTKLEQLGTVTIEDDVEIGANTTIDRARFKETRIGKGTKIDNLVQIGHNVSLGDHNIIVSQTGIAGSSKTGRNVIMGGQAGVVGHVEIADFVMIATRGGVSKSITKAGKYAGGPVVSLLDHNKQQVHSRKLPEYVKKIENLEKRLAALESSVLIGS